MRELAYRQVVAGNRRHRIWTIINLYLDQLYNFFRILINIKMFALQRVVLC